MMKKKLHTICMLLFLFCLCPQAMAQDFDYEDSEQTIIYGLTEVGRSKTSLTIPVNVTMVRNGSFWGNIVLEELHIEGDPDFESASEAGEDEGTLEDVKATLKKIDMGSAISADHMKKLLLSYGERDDTDLLETIEIDYLGESVNWGGDEHMSDAINNVWTENVSVILPAELVDDQVFGYAKVYGRFNHTTELSTFCGKATFQDVDDGSNWLFYIPTELRPADKQVYIKRVWVLKAGQGILIHKAENSAPYVDVLRVAEDEVSYSSLEEDYSHNMLVGVTERTLIGETSGDNGEYTNMILYQGSFRRTYGGYLGANRAYLRVLTSDLNALGTDANLSVTYDDEIPDAIQDVMSEEKRSERELWFSIDGQRLPARPVQSGIYLHGRKVVVIQ